MISAVYTALRDALKAKGVPFDVVYGPVQTTAGPTTRIEVQRDISGGDLIGAGKARTQNPKMFAVRGTGGLVRILAKSTIANASRQDHEDLADLIVDQVEVELVKLARNAHVGFAVTRSSFVTDTTIPDGWGGVVYELGFRIDRAVSDTSWKGAASVEGSYTGAATSSTPTGPDPGDKSLPSATTRIDS